MNAAAPTPAARQRACAVRRAEHASKRRGFCRNQPVASSQITASVGIDDGGGLIFLQTDPVPGGSANAYDYCSQDPINCTDLNGQFGWSSITHFVKNHWKSVLRKVARTLVIGGALTGIVACTLATAGVCGTAVGTFLVTGAIGAVASGAAYGLGRGKHTRSGYEYAAVTGFLFGPPAGGLLPFGIGVPTTAQHARPMSMLDWLKDGLWWFK